MIESRAVVAYEWGGVGRGRREGSEAAPGNFQGSGCVHYPDCDDGFIGVPIHQN